MTGYSDIDANKFAVDYSRGEVLMSSSDEESEIEEACAWCSSIPLCIYLFLCEFLLILCLFLILLPYLMMMTIANMILLPIRHACSQILRLQEGEDVWAIADGSDAVFAEDASARFDSIA